MWTGYLESWSKWKGSRPDSDLRWVVEGVGVRGVPGGAPASALGEADLGIGGAPKEIGEKNPPDDIGRGGTELASMKGGGVGGTICCPLIPGDIKGTFLELPLFRHRLLMPLTEITEPVRSLRDFG